ncbi:MAG: patatin-like phospholipase family protein [Bryobacterales bacterium]|nr:patatin-like phospholipase family protein [Bryobacterales bacterium]
MRERSLNLAYLYLLRVPLLGAAFLALFPLLSLHRGGPAYFLLHGIFDITALDLFFVSGQVALLVTTLAVVTFLVFRNGPARFRLPEVDAMGVARWFALLYAAAGVFFLARTTGVAQGAAAQKAAAIAAGCAVAAGLVALGRVLWPKPSAWLSLRNTRKTEPARAANHRGVPRTMGARDVPFALLMKRLTGRFGPGYVDEKGNLLPGHGFAVLCLAIFSALYLLIALRAIPRTATLCSVLNLVFVGVYLISGLAFLCDRFRVPVLLALAIPLLATARWFDTDFYFAAAKASRVEPLTPLELMAASPYDTAVIVSAQGGGIQAAAWTAEVLARLDEALGGEFAPRVRLISSVSGGSLGAMYFSAGYHGGKVSGHEAIVRAARASSLEEIAFGLVYRDLPRMFLPFASSRLADRGAAAERAWSAQDGAPAESVMLARWREETRRGQRPANIFNAMAAETGQRCLLSTVDLGRSSGRREFAEMYPGLDVRPVTAVRLSASFPYVTPAARVAAEVHEPYHFVDGGYFDNYGVLSAVDVLLAGTAEAGPVKRILLIDIAAAQEPSAALKTRGWFYQVLAPPEAFLAMRNTAQVSRNYDDVRMARIILEGRGLEFHQVSFRFPSEEAPLSWHLTQAEKEAIDEAWTHQKQAVQDVREFLKLP